MMRQACSICATCLWLLFPLFSLPVLAETLFVSDKLSVNVYAERDLQGQPVFSLDSGTAVKLLETEGELARISYKQKQTGWLPKQYLSKEKPLQLAYLQVKKKLELAQAEILQLKQQRSDQKEFSKTAKALGKFKQRNHELESELTQSTTELEAKSTALRQVEARVSALNEELHRLKTANTPPVTTPLGLARPPQGFTLPISWTILALVVVLVGGFALGVKYIEGKMQRMKE